MAVTKTLLNWRESCIPELSRFDRIGVEPPEFQPGIPAVQTFVREYRAVLQILVEGDTRDVLQDLTATGAVFGNVTIDWPPLAGNIQVDDGNFFVPETDLNPPSSVENLMFFMVTEIIGNYSKEQYGKLSFSITVEAFGPQEYYDLVTGEWKLVPLAEGP